MGHQFIYGTTLFFMVLLNSINTTAQSTITLPAVCGCTGGTISTLDCGAAINNGTLNHGTPASGVYSIIPYTGGDGGTYSAQTVSSTGVTGLTATLTAGGFPMGNSDLIYTISGTPTSSGTAMFPINIGGQSCVLTRAVAAQLIPSNPIGMGSFSGKACFDIAESNDNSNSCAPLTARTPIRANFNQIATNTQTYTFTPIGTVSNVRFYYVNTNGQVIMSISGGNSGNNISTAQTATVVYNTALSSPNPSSPTSALALGLTRSNPLTADIYVVYNDGATNNGTDLQLNITANIKDCSCCGAYISATMWKEFLCHNLGANTSLDPHDMTQTNAWGLNGAYIQWGKRGPNTTGDSRVDWVTAANDGPNGFAAAPTASNANTPAVTLWNTTNAANYSWRTADGVKTANDPCPNGYRVPTQTELLGVTTNNVMSFSGSNWTASNTNYSNALHLGPNSSAKLLTLPAAGFRANADGLLTSRGGYGYYHSSTEHPDGISLNAMRFGNGSGAVTVSASVSRRGGISVRCIAE